MLWVKENEPKVLKKVAQVLLSKDYLRYKLIGTKRWIIQILQGHHC